MATPKTAFVAVYRGPTGDGIGRKLSRGTDEMEVWQVGYEYAASLGYDVEDPSSSVEVEELPYADVFKD